MSCIMLWLVYLSFMIRIVVGQAATATTSTLSETPSPYMLANGNFTSPSGGTASFDQGSSMVIQWDSPYTEVNLYYIWRGNRSVELSERQCQIALGVSQTSQDWMINCAIPPNCNTEDCSGSSIGPFVLRAVNTLGSAEDLTGGGFYSREFYIQPIPSLISTSSSASSTTTSSSTSSTAATSSTHSTTETSSTTSTASPIVATVAPDNSHSSVFIGAGVGVGTGVALLIGMGAFFLWRCQSRKVEQRDVRQLPTYPESNAAWEQKPEYYEIAAASPAEAPTREPQELPGRDFH